MAKKKARTRNIPVVKEPCSNCPFRSDIEQYLNRARAEEIAKSLLDGNGSVFPCHKSVDYGKSSKGRCDWANRTIPCAGACIVTHNTLGDFNGLMQIGERLGVFSLAELNFEAPVFESMAAFVEANDC